MTETWCRCRGAVTTKRRPDEQVYLALEPGTRALWTREVRTYCRKCRNGYSFIECHDATVVRTTSIGRVVLQLDDGGQVDVPRRCVCEVQ